MLFLIVKIIAAISVSGGAYLAGAYASASDRTDLDSNQIDGYLRKAMVFAIATVACLLFVIISILVG